MEEQEPLTKKEQIQAQREDKMLQKEIVAKKLKMKKIFVAGAAVIIVVLIVWTIASSTKSPSEVGNLTADPFAGLETATVVVKEYADFQCPACAGVYPVVKDLIEEYGDRVKFVYNDFPLPQHEHSRTSAVGAQCAFEQGKFYDFHDSLFENQKVWAPLDADEAEDTFRGYAEEIGLDMTAFETCVSGEAAPAAVNEDMAEAKSLGVNSTPTFFVNDKRIVGAPFSSTLRKAIDEALGAQ